MFAIKWTSNNPITKNSASGLNQEVINGEHKVTTFDTPEEAEQKIVELKKTASWSISFEVIPYEG